MLVKVIGGIGERNVIQILTLDHLKRISKEIKFKVKVRKLNWTEIRVKEKVIRSKYSYRKRFMIKEFKRTMSIIINTI